MNGTINKQLSIDDQKIISKGHLDRKSGGGSPYNFDLKPLIQDFSFYEFMYEALGHSEYDYEHGAFVVITDKQYIIGYNAGFGTGTHISSFARVMKELNGGGDIGSFSEAFRLNSMCENRFFLARIIYEVVDVSDNSVPKLAGYINFSLGDVPVTSSKFEVFKKFYEDYNSEIKSVCRKYNNFKVIYSYIDNGIIRTGESDSLDELFEYISEHVVYDKPETSKEDERILGVKVKNVVSMLQ